MRRILFLLILLSLALTSPVRAWGYLGHRRVNRQAARIVEGSFGEFVKSNETALAWYGPVPDYLKSIDQKEFPRHFIDADLYGTFPFKDIPADYDSLIAKYGEDNVFSWGYLPWVIESTCDRIIRLLKQNRFDEAIFHMGRLGHYISDLFMPLHTVKNYNGQFTGNEGVHFRWEGRLVNEYVKNIQPFGTAAVIQNPLERALNIMRNSFNLHSQILAADTKARKLLTPDQISELDTYKILTYEKPYLDVLYAETKDLLHRQLGGAVTSIADYWLYCYTAAGSPDLSD